MSPLVRSLAAASAAAAAIAGCAARSGPPTALQADGRRPNIILILTDDLDLAPVPYMPYLRSELTARGVSFSNAFVTDSVCAPSRVSIFTGQYVHGHGVIDNPPPSGGFRRWYRDGGEASTLATWLSDAGYRTGLIGKYVNYYPQASNANYVPPGWSDWHGLFFQEAYYQFKMNRNGSIVDYGTTLSDYQTDVLHQQALEFIDSTRSDQPFFLQLSFYAPHPPSIPADRHAELFPELKAPRPPSFDEEDVSDKPAWVQSQPRLSDAVIDEIDERFRNRVRMLQSVDESIAGLLRRLEQRGQLDDTWIFFTSDNGFQHGGHRMDHGKGDAYDESIRVPLIVRGPGAPRNMRLEHFALNIDLAPTFAELAGAAIPEWVDGRSLAPLLNAQPLPLDEWRSDFLIEHWAQEQGGIPEYAALRTQKQLYVEYPTGERELYDLEADPGQLENLLAPGWDQPPPGAADAAPATVTAAGGDETALALAPGDAPRAAASGAPGKPGVEADATKPSAAGLLDWLAARLQALRVCQGESCRTKPAPLEPSPADTPAQAPTPRDTPTKTRDNR